jgi:hypothetical protein
MSDWQGLEEEIQELMGDVRFVYGFDSGATGGSKAVRISKIPDYTKVTDDISTAEMALWPKRTPPPKASKSKISPDTVASILASTEPAKDLALKLGISRGAVDYYRKGSGRRK